MSNNNNVQINIGGLFLQLVTVLFIYLKLTDQILWSWWWVLAPMWMPIAAFIVIALVIAILSFIIEGNK